ncbi:MAG: MBL fold metallo-hydrolase [Bacteroidia bacterium]|nr:MBL fold metallo-hydrolase [Bacteroidia bacterium]
MITVHQLTYGPFAENTYILSDADNQAIIIDPGMYHPQENTAFFEYLNAKSLVPVRMILTHAHLDHVFGVNWVNSNYNLSPELNQDDKIIYDNAALVANQYGLQMEKLVPATIGLEDGSQIAFGGSTLDVIFAPGHSPGSVCFYSKEDGFVIGGDVLFQGSIGRTDLPGGNFETLITSIKSRLLVLPDNTIVYSGHGPLTNIGQERISNPFLQA